MNKMTKSKEIPSPQKIIEVEDNGSFLFVNFGAPSIEDYRNEKLLNELKKLANYLEDGSPAKVVVFKGLSTSFPGESFSPNLGYFRRWEKILHQIAKLPMATLALIDGDCVGFNMQFAINCDFRLGTKDARFISPEIKEGYLPGMTTYYLTKYIGMGMTRKVILAGIPLLAEKAFEYGLLDVLSDKTNVETELYNFIKIITPNNKKIYQMGRRLLNESYYNSYDTALGKLLAVQSKCLDASST